MKEPFGGPPEKWRETVAEPPAVREMLEELGVITGEVGDPTETLPEAGVMVADSPVVLSARLTATTFVPTVA